ncbi:vitellogenin-1 isoform X1 [Canna indica]|uniref:Vitellogenin-1 isoform X1 n=1 Tax=Canna indica TaxID=4628 RepID=A0AAQ3KNB5_9LILI|nr:vitellogenin-1 isoform X1 [Canna indica]
MGRDRLTPSSASSSDGESSDRKRRRKRSKKKEGGRSSRDKESSRHKKSKHSKDDSRARGHVKEHREKSRHKRKSERRRRRSGREDDHDEGSEYSRSSSASSGEDSEPQSPRPEEIVRLFLREFPNAADDLKQLLQMIDSRQGVDVRGISDRSLVKLIKKLFQSLKLKRNENGVYLLSSKGVPTLDIVGSTLCSHLKTGDSLYRASEVPENQQPSTSDHISKDQADSNDTNLDKAQGKHEVPAPARRRLIGPERPSGELLAAAAELTEAEGLLREADLGIDDGLLIGPPPPAMVTEAASANEAERFEEVSRIIGADVDKPYDILGVNWKMSSDNIKKRYWKLSLMVHPDKCSHPQAHQAFVLLNQAFKDIQDPDKRKSLDEKIKRKEEEEEMKVELQALRHAAEWRKLQGISMEGDDDLLAMPTAAPKRDEWMTTLPPERKPGGMPMQSTSFSRTTKEGRGDTSMWTDSPLDKAQKARQNYLEAYNKAKALGDVEDDKKRTSGIADLVDKYNASKRSVSLVQKHREESSRPKKKMKQQQQEKEEWEGMHPWKPWDREKDLTAGRKKVNLDVDNMSQGLSSRFSSGSVQRNFL